MVLVNIIKKENNQIIIKLINKLVKQTLMVKQSNEFDTYIYKTNEKICIYMLQWMLNIKIGGK